jgi:hypothetical protein
MRANQIRFSPEIEVEFPNDVDLKSFALADEDLKEWQIKDECSLDHGLEFCPKEGNKLYFNAKGLKQIEKLVKILRKHGCRTTNDCGLHIHVDTSRISREHLRKLGEAFYNGQDDIYEKFDVDERRQDFFCAKLNDEDIPIGSSKDYGITHSDFGTLEFRLFNGELDYKYVKDCIKWVLKFMNTGKIK